MFQLVSISVSISGFVEKDRALLYMPRNGKKVKE